MVNSRPKRGGNPPNYDDSLIEDEEKPNGFKANKPTATPTPIIDHAAPSQQDPPGSRPRRAAAAAAEAAIAHTAVLEHDGRVSATLAAEQLELERYYNQRAIEEATFQAALTASLREAPAAAQKRKEIPLQEDQELPPKRTRIIEEEITAASPGQQQEEQQQSRSRRQSKPSVRLIDIHNQDSNKKRPTYRQYNTPRMKYSPNVAIPPSVGLLSSPLIPPPLLHNGLGDSALAAAPFPTSPGGSKPITPYETHTDIPSLIQLAATCDTVDAVVAAIDARLPAYKGNNIHARLLRLAFSNLRLGAFTVRKVCVAFMAKKLWLLAGKMGELAANQAASTVGVEHLPGHLKPYGATDATPLTSFIADTAVEQYFGSDAVPRPKAYGGVGAGYRVSSSAADFIAPVVNLADYDERLLKLAEISRTLLGMRGGGPVKLQQVLKTNVLAGQRVEYRNRAGQTLQTGEITEGGLIRCNCSLCCGLQEISPTDFEIHSGSGERRPADSIYFANFPHTLRDLLNVIMSESKAAVDVHMDYCLLCKKGGDLLCCDGCTAAYHLECTGLHGVPDGDWFCPSCVMESARQHAMSSRGRGRGRGRGSRGRGRGRGRGGRGGAAGGRVHMLAPSAQRRQGRPTRNFNRNKRLFEGVEGGLKDCEPLFYMNRGIVVLNGTAVINPAGQSGILCECCNKIISCSQFEAHAGHQQRRQPYECIFTGDGRNLKAIAAAIPAPEGGDADGGGDDSPDEPGDPGHGTGGCVICHDPDFQRGAFGPRTMMLCDQCEREFHVGCMASTGMATIDSLPEGDWFCSGECGKIHGLLRKYVAGGQIPVVFDDDGVPQSVLSEQVPKKGDNNSKIQPPAAAKALQLPSEDEVKAAAEAMAAKLNEQLAKFENNGVSIEDAPLPSLEGVTGTEKGPSSMQLDSQQPIPSTVEAIDKSGYTWQVLNGKQGKAGTKGSVKAAAEILQESFDPIIDMSTNTDLLPLMLHAQQYGDWDYRNVYTLLLRYQGKPVVAATSRIFGPQYAELPLIATRLDARRQGHARVLVNLYLALLQQAGVHQLVLPAAHETVETWKNGFGFVDMPEDEVAMAKQQLRILVFPGTEVLWMDVNETKKPTGHHVLKPLPDYEDVKAVRAAMVDLIRDIAVAEGEEAPPPPPEPVVAVEEKKEEDQQQPGVVINEGNAVDVVINAVEEQLNVPADGGEAKTENDLVVTGQ